MTYYINPLWFYLLGVSEGVKIASIILSVGLLFMCIFLGVICIDCQFDDKNIVKCFKAFLTAFAVTLMLSILVPSEQTCKEMMIASVVTHENVDTAKQDVKEIVDYVFEKVEENSEED